MRNLIQRRPNEALPELAPAMTSKEAQKRWREKNKQPRMSRAEQFRLEWEEQARIKAEFEKEKAANRARLLREKKKEKEQRILDEKRKKGLPLVDVRPSQSTISWFVRPGPPAKRKHDETREPDEDQQPQRPHPTQRDHQQEDHANVQPVPSPRPSPRLVAAVTADLYPMDPPPSTQPAPLASAQCFDDFDDLEDLLPSASQMDRELHEEYNMRRPQLATTEAPLPTPRVYRPPVPLFGDSNGVKSNEFTPEVPMSLAALPAPVPADEVDDRIKTAIDYFSSQDWDLSSQEVRDLEGTIQPHMAVQLSPQKAQQSSYRPEPSLPKASPTAHAPVSAKRDAPQSSEPPRFFGSSGEGVELLMGLWESRKLAQLEEQRRQEAEKRRLAEEQLQREQLQGELEEIANDLLGPLSQCSIHHDDTEEAMHADSGRLQSELRTEDLAVANPAPAAPGAESDDGGSESKKLGDTNLPLLDHVAAAPQDESDYGGSEFKGLGEATISLLDPVAPSQAESDYGDAGFKELGEEALTLLEEAAMASVTTAALPAVIVTPAADSGVARNDLCQNSNAVVDLNASFGLGDGSWLSDDDELDL